MTFSIVIPTLNEAANIQKCLESVLKGYEENPPQVIVVDAGSMDQTCELVSAYAEVTLVSDPTLKGTKYASLNRGGELATGDIIIFPDADTLLPSGYQELINEKLVNPQCVGGAFEHSFDTWTLFLRFVAAINRLRYRISHRFYGDQAVFCRRSIFKDIKGYPEIMIMESARFCDQLKKHGKLCIVHPPVITSSRRFLEQGQVKVFLNDLRILLSDLLRIPLDKSGKKYWQHNEEVKDIG